MQMQIQIQIQKSSTKQLMLFREIITVYFQNRVKFQNTLCGQSSEPFSFKAKGTQSNDHVSNS
jgi:hypothetical protein